MNFSKDILKWYNANKRELPWRQSKEPYQIWLSEIILQQTRVVQGIPYYEKFVTHFPTVFDMAAAQEQAILKLWQGLGYYSRARNMHATAKILVEQHQGVFPATYKELLKLKGIGDYTASAIASICFEEPEPVVDGNVYRVLSRYFGIDIPINSTKGKKYFKQLAYTVMDDTNIRDYNQGIMEFGAIQCTPKKPQCMACPLNENCVALSQHKIGKLPVKIKTNKIKKRYFNYLIFNDKNGSTIMEQRKGKGIWQGLFQFPLIETVKMVEFDFISHEIEKNFPKENIASIKLFNKVPVVHKLSHQHLNTLFWIVETKTSIKGGIPWFKIEAYPTSVLIADFIKRFKN